MPALVHQDYAPASETGAHGWLHAMPMKRLIIALAGGMVMAISGTGLASYLDTSAVTGADAASVDVESLN